MPTSPSSEPSGAQRPTHLTVPPRASSAGREVVELAASAGLILDDWQAFALDQALGERSDGQWSAMEVGLLVPRQNGKGSILEARELAGLFLFGEKLILHSAHEFKTAAEAFRRLLFLVESTDDLDKLVQRVSRSHGEEGIELRRSAGGGRIRFVARSRGSGRGFSGDTVILDEAYNLQDTAMSALMPTMAAMPNPQIWYTSSAPLEEPESDVIRRIGTRGRSGVSPRLCWMEWCADLDADVDDRDAWAQANPGYPFRIGEEFIELERGTLTDEDFGRERLGIWNEEDESDDSIIPREDWTACLDPKSTIAGTERFALDVSPDRSSAAIASAGASSLGGMHIEVVEHRPGTGWLVARAVALQEKWGGTFAIAENSPAWSLKPDLDAAGVKLSPVSVSEHAQACGRLFDAAMRRTLRHIGQDELNRALKGAVTRPYGDAWLWSRKSSAVDITPLVSVTLAAWLHDVPNEAPVPQIHVFDDDDEAA